MSLIYRLLEYYGVIINYCTSSFNIVWTLDAVIVIIIIFYTCFIIVELNIIILIQARATIHIQLHGGTLMRCSASMAFLITESFT